MDAISGANTSTSASSYVPTAEATDSGSSTAISSDFETFLRMLTVQMENQDPLNPIESSDFAVQLATFSSVEQQVRTNDLLEAMIGQQPVSALSQIAGWVGMEARAAVPAAFTGEPVTYYTDPVRDADQATLVVENEAGTQVSRVAVSSTATTGEWSGTDSSGATLPDGNYTLRIEYRSEGTLSSTKPVEVYAPISEARLSDGEPVVIFSTGGEVNADAVTAVRPPAALDE